MLNVPFFDNFGDNYTIIVNADGFQDGAWRPVTVYDRAPVTTDILLLPKNGAFHFDGATWDKLNQVRPNVAKMIRACSPTPEAAAAMYTSGFENRPKSIACFLNLVTAMADMQLPSGKTPLDYYWNAVLAAGRPHYPAWIQQFDSVMKQDRIFCYVDQAILADVQAATGWAHSPRNRTPRCGDTSAPRRATSKCSLT